MQDTLSHTVHSFLLTGRGEQEYSDLQTSNSQFYNPQPAILQPATHNFTTRNPQLQNPQPAIY